VLDVRENVFVMRKSAGQFGHVRVFERIVPEDFLGGPINLVAVVKDSSGVKVKEFPHIQNYIPHESYLSLEFGQGGADGSQDQCGVTDTGITLSQRVDKFAVGLEVWDGH
jgi:hypothetical protein